MVLIKYEIDELLGLAEGGKSGVQNRMMLWKHLSFSAMQYFVVAVPYEEEEFTSS